MNREPNPQSTGAGQAEAPSGRLRQSTTQRRPRRVSRWAVTLLGVALFWAGLGFLSLYAYGVLPAVFALPAGLGDMAIGFTAPWIILALVRRPAFAASAAFIRWNVLGILDLVVAVTIGTVSAMLASGAPGEISTAPMATLPLLLIPAFLVPLFLMLHITALMQSRQIGRSRA